MREKPDRPKSAGVDTAPKKKELEVFPMEPCQEPGHRVLQSADHLR